MKKIFKILLALSMVALILSGCSSKLNEAKKAKNLLCSGVSDKCDTISQTITDTWYDYIANDYKTNTLTSTLASKYNVSEDVVKQAGELIDCIYAKPTDDVNGKSGLGFLFYLSGGEGWVIQDFSTAVNFYIAILEVDGTFDELNDNLNEAYESIQKLSSNEKYYNSLKDLYTYVSGYLDYCQSPTGNYSQATSYILDYQQNILRLKNDLDISLK